MKNREESNKELESLMRLSGFFTSEAAQDEIEAQIDALIEENELPEIEDEEAE